MRCLPEENDARIANPPKQWFEVGGVDRVKLLAGCRHSLGQRPLRRFDHWAIFRRDGTTLLRCPTFLAYERDEADISDILGLVVVLRYTDHAQQFLNAPINPHRNDQPASDLELSLQGFRYLWAARRDHDRVIRCVIGPTSRSVGMQHVHIRIAELGQHRSSLFGELADALDRINIASNSRQNGRGVTRAGADLQHLFTAFERQSLGHQRDDIRLRDRLIFCDRQRRVFIREFPQRLGQEGLARDGSHGVQNQGRAHPTPCHLAVNHTIAERCKIDLVHCHASQLTEIA